MSTGCAGHAALADELREYATGALDQLEPWLARLRDRLPDQDDPEPASCAVCPFCAVITVLRGGRSELAVRLAEHAAGLVAVLRAALQEGVGAPGDGGGTRSSPEQRREVQRIPVVRGENPVSGPC